MSQNSFAFVGNYKLPTLATNATIVMVAFLSTVLNLIDAAPASPGITPGNLADLLLPDVQRRIYYGIAPNAQLEAAFAIPNFPELYAGNAAAATIGIYNQTVATIMFCRNFLSASKIELLEACGETIRAMMWDPIHGHSRLTPRDILTFLYTNFGTVTEADISSLRQRISTLITSDDLVAAGRTNQKTGFAQMDSLGQPVNQADQIAALDAAIAHLPRSVAAAMFYKNNNNFMQRTADAQAAYIHNNYSHQVVPIASFANATIAGTNPGGNGPPTNPVGNGSPVLPGPVKLKRPHDNAVHGNATFPRFCFKHRWCQHWGTACRHPEMAADPTKQAMVRP